MDKTKKQLMLRGILWGLCACILLSMFLTFFELDFKSAISGVSQSVSNWVSGNGLLGIVGKTDLIKVSGLNIISSLFKADKSMDAAGQNWVIFLRFMVLIPYGVAIAAAILTFFSKRWGYLTSAIASAAACVFEVLSTFLFVPSIISAELADGAGQLAESITSDSTESALGDAISHLAGSVASSNTSKAVTPGVIRKVVTKGIGPAWWMTILALAGIAAVTIFMLIAFRTETAAAAAPEEPAMVCSAGALPGIPITFRGSEEIIIGSSPEEANYIVSERDCSPRHCSVRYESASGRYILTVYGSSYVSLKNEALGAGPHYMDRGSVLQLGYGSCSLTLI